MEGREFCEEAEGRRCNDKVGITQKVKPLKERKGKGERNMDSIWRKGRHFNVVLLLYCVLILGKFAENIYLFINVFVLSACLKTCLFVFGPFLFLNGQPPTLY